MLFELFRVAAVLAGVEWGRRTKGPLPLLQAIRARGARCRRRGVEDRARLQRAIRRIDRLVPPIWGNCYRRALLEIALDAGAASEPLMFGLKAHGAPGSGHSWLESAHENASYDCVFSA